MKLATILKDFFLRYGEQGACCASWRGSYEPPVPEALKNAVIEKKMFSSIIKRRISS